MFKKWWFWLIIIFILFIVIANLMNPSTQEISTTNTKLKEIGYNKRDYNRIYSIAVINFVDDEEVWNAMEEYAKNKMYTQGATTCVIFFDGEENTPDVTLIGLDYPEKYDDYTLAIYWKYANGKEIFEKYPMK